MLKPHSETHGAPSASSPLHLGDLSAHQPESTRRMAERMNEIWRTAQPLVHPFLGERTADAFRDKLQKAKSFEEAMKLKSQYALSLLNAGHPEAALNELKDYEYLILNKQLRLSPTEAAAFFVQKAICSLRMGEMENCIANHNADSCLAPLAGGGIHLAQRGSRGAIAILSAALSVDPENLDASWLLNIAYMTVGEYPDKVPSRWLIPPKAFASDYDIKRFPDVAIQTGLDLDSLAGGVVLEDFDHDGFLDLMISDWGENGWIRVFRNNGDGTFTERTAAAGLEGLKGGLNMITADYNNDGQVDIFVLRGAWLAGAGEVPNSLLRNNGDFTFTEVTEEAGLLSFHPTQTGAWFDYDGDGWIDLFIGNESDKEHAHPCELYHNNRDGTFTECAAANGVTIMGMVKGVAAGDFNNDGRPDLYLSLRYQPNLLLRNDGPANPGTPSPTQWRFTDVAKSAGVTEPIFSFPCWFFDYDNDGWLDLIVFGYSIRGVGDVAADYLGIKTNAPTARLYHNNRDGTFTDVSESCHVAKVLLTMGCNFGDLDNDGWLDFYCGTGNPDFTTIIPSRMFRNNGGKGFQDVTTSGGFGQLQKGHGIAFGDLNNDGDQDIYSVVGGAYPGDNYHNELFANPGHGNHWLKLNLEGVRSNRAAIGTRIKVVVATQDGERSIYKDVNSGACFGASPLRQEIGLGAARSIVRLELFWPATGKTDKIQGLELDRCYHIRESDTIATEVHLKSFKFPALGDAPLLPHQHRMSEMPH